MTEHISSVIQRLRDRGDLPRRIIRTVAAANDYVPAGSVLTWDPEDHVYRTEDREWVVWPWYVRDHWRRFFSPAPTQQLRLIA